MLDTKQTRFRRRAREIMAIEAFIGISSGFMYLNVVGECVLGGCQACQATCLKSNKRGSMLSTCCLELMFSRGNCEVDSGRSLPGINLLKSWRSENQISSPPKDIKRSSAPCPFASVQQASATPPCPEWSSTCPRLPLEGLKRAMQSSEARRWAP